MTNAEVIIRSAEMRLENALRLFRRQMYGDENYEREVVEGLALDIVASKEPGPDPSVRKRLLPNWAWRKRLGR